MRRKEDEPKPPTPHQEQLNIAGTGDCELTDIYNAAKGTREASPLKIDKLKEAVLLADDWFKNTGIKRRYL